MTKTIDLTQQQSATPPRRSAADEFNFLVTNRVPRIALTRFVGWVSKIEHPWVCAAALAAWRLFSKLDLSEAKEQHFNSLHACFTRELKPGLRPVEADPQIMASPCDAIVGACGKVQGDTLLQAKGLTYTLADFFGGGDVAKNGAEAEWERYRDGTYVTLRLTSTMYHRFHAPYDGDIEHVTYISGDAWNVNPPAVARIAKLYCRNERALIRMRLSPAAGGHTITLAPVAAILVASIRLKFADVLLHLKYRGPNEIPCAASVQKGEELGWFEHGSTIIVFAPKGFELCAGVQSGAVVRMGRGLMRVPEKV